VEQLPSVSDFIKSETEPSLIEGVGPGRAIRKRDQLGPIHGRLPRLTMAVLSVAQDLQRGSLRDLGNALTSVKLPDPKSNLGRLS
jgi:hypothetical protein